LSISALDDHISRQRNNL
jgi:two-component system, chemotaxis family, protein-glutamate methylesterase/glutaminase